MQITKVDAPACEGGEQPWWDTDRQCLYYIDNTGQKIHRFTPGTGHCESWPTPSVITSFALCTDGDAIVTMRSGIHRLNLQSGVFSPLHPLPDPPPLVYNDAKADRQGRWLIGGSTARFKDPAPDGGLFRLDPCHTLTRLDGDIHFSNGPCFSPDGRTLYFSDSWRKECYAYDYDPLTGEVANRRVFFTTADLGGLPDGATVDTSGRIWIALYGAGKVVAVSPGGMLERTVDMPVKLVSSIMFGGPRLDRLYVTTIAHGSFDEPLEDGAGSLYVIDGVDATGFPEPRYAG